MFKTILLSAVLFCHCAAAQPIDLRARSLRGAQAHPYGVAVRPAAPQPSVYRSPVSRSSAAQSEQTGTVADADGENGFICEDEAMLPQMMRDFWTSVGRRDIKCE